MAMVCCRLTAGQNLIKGSGLYAYPAGTSFCSCKRKQNTLGDTPRPRRTGTPARKAKGRLPEAWAKRCLQGAVGTSAPFPSPPPKRGRGILSHFLLVLLQRSASAECYGHKRTANPQVLTHWRHSSPPKRRGEGWWFALRAPARGLLESPQGRKTLWGEEGAPQRRGLPAV